MQIHNLKPLHKPKARKRIGRGGKRGNYSGRGSKGQRSRAGAKIRPQLREMINKFPKKRGEGFRVIKSITKEVQLKDIKKTFPQGGIISPQVLIKAGLIKRTPHHKLIVKILGNEILTNVYNVNNCFLSRQAKEAIIKAGGQIKQ